MHRFDETTELEPMDVVARAIEHEMKKTGSECVNLDIRHKTKELISAHFPTI